MVVEMLSKGCQGGQNFVYMLSMLSKSCRAIVQGQAKPGRSPGIWTVSVGPVLNHLGAKERAGVGGRLQHASDLWLRPILRFRPGRYCNYFLLEEQQGPNVWVVPSARGSK